MMSIKFQPSSGIYLVVRTSSQQFDHLWRLWFLILLGWKLEIQSYREQSYFILWVCAWLTTCLLRHFCYFSEAFFPKCACQCLTTYMAELSWNFKNVMDQDGNVLILDFMCQVLGTDELNAYLNKYHIELDLHLSALVGRLVMCDDNFNWLYLEN